MKRLVLIFYLLFTGTCFADMVVIYDKTTKEVYTVSEKEDTIVPVNCEKKIVTGFLSDFTDENPTNYKFVGNKFVKNISKISAQEQAKIEQEERQAEEKLTQDQVRADAIKALTDKGVILKYNK